MSKWEQYLLLQKRESLLSFFIFLEPYGKPKEIFRLETILLNNIKVMLPQSSKIIVRSRRCQYYGHMKSYCTLQKACIKCDNEHSWYKNSRKTSQSLHYAKVIHSTAN